MNDDLYVWWRNALEGVIGHVHDGAPMPGYYRLRTLQSSGKRGAAKFINAEPVAIWQQADGKIVASVGDYYADDVNELWLHVAKYPVTEDEYYRVREGYPWADVATMEEL